jgi:hypothetical protein
MSRLDLLRPYPHFVSVTTTSNEGYSWCHSARASFQRRLASGGTLPGGERTVERWFNLDAGFERDTKKQLQYNYRTLPFRCFGIRGDGAAASDIPGAA